MTPELLKLECLKIAAQQCQAGPDALSLARAFYEFLMVNEHELPPAAQASSPTGRH